MRLTFYSTEICPNRSLKKEVKCKMYTRHIKSTCLEANFHRLPRKAFDSVHWALFKVHTGFSTVESPKKDRPMRVHPLFQDFSFYILFFNILYIAERPTFMHTHTHTHQKKHPFSKTSVFFFKNTPSLRLQFFKHYSSQFKVSEILVYKATQHIGCIPSLKKKYFSHLLGAYN